MVWTPKEPIFPAWVKPQTQGQIQSWSSNCGWLGCQMECVEPKQTLTGEDRAQHRLSEGAMGDCDLLNLSPKQDTSFCPRVRLSQKQPFTLCAAVPPGPRGASQCTFQILPTSLTTHTLIPNRPIQAVNSNKFLLDADCLWWTGKCKQGLS